MQTRNCQLLRRKDRNEEGLGKRLRLLPVREQRGQFCLSVFVSRCVVVGVSHHTALTRPLQRGRDSTYVPRAPPRTAPPPLTVPACAGVAGTPGTTVSVNSAPDGGGPGGVVPLSIVSCAPASITRVPEPPRMSSGVLGAQRAENFPVGAGAGVVDRRQRGVSGTGETQCWDPPSSLQLVEVEWT